MLYRNKISLKVKVNEEQGHMIFCLEKKPWFFFLFGNERERDRTRRERERLGFVWLSPVKDPFGELVWQT
jgi:hypothetical protein